MGGRGGSGGAERTITLYHRTSAAAADAIVRDGNFKGDSYDKAYFATRKNGGAKQYGSAIVAITIPKSELNVLDVVNKLSGERYIPLTPERLKYLNIKPRRIK